MLRSAWQAGVVMTGLSAGSLCWFEHGVTAFHGESRPIMGMGFLPYSNAVHYDDKPERRSAFLTAVADGMIPGYGTGDGAALHFVGTDLAEVVTSRPTACAFHVTREGETELATRYLERTLAAA
jgi:peptidase E